MSATIEPLPGVLSKSKLLSFRQCPKRLWLKIHRPELVDNLAATESSFATGHQVGGVARRLYDSDGTGVTIDIETAGVAAAIASTAAIQKVSIIDLRHVPDRLLNAKQLRVKAQTLSGLAYVGARDAAAALAAHSRPASFLDFEITRFAVPIWKGTHSHQQPLIQFQFSVRQVSRSGSLEKKHFSDPSGNDARHAFADALIGASGKRGPAFVFRGFEMTQIGDVAQQFPLDAEAAAPETMFVPRGQIRRVLIAYCGLDTLAMVRVWEFSSGRARVAV